MLLENSYVDSSGLYLILQHGLSETFKVISSRARKGQDANILSTSLSNEVRQSTIPCGVVSFVIVDGTLSLLLNSAQYRGVPHRAIYNLNRLRKAHAVWIHGKHYSGSKNAWNPKAAVADNSKPRAPQRPRDIDRMERNRVHEHCWDALGEIVRMAEGRHNLSLSRLNLKPWTSEKR